jgi:hypothetical protein
MRYKILHDLINITIRKVLELVLVITIAIDSCSKSVNTVTGDRNFRKHIKHNSFTN